MSQANTDDSSQHGDISIIDTILDCETQMPPDAVMKPIYNEAEEESQLASWKPSIFKAVSLKRPTKGKLTKGVRVKGATNMVKRSITFSDVVDNTFIPVKTTEPCTQALPLAETAEDLLFSTLNITTDHVQQWDQFQNQWKSMPWIPLAKAIGDTLRALIRFLLVTSGVLSTTPLTAARDMFCCRISFTCETVQIMTQLWDSFLSDCTTSKRQVGNIDSTRSSSSLTTPYLTLNTSMPTTFVPITKAGVPAPSSATYLHIAPDDDLLMSMQCQLPIGETSSSIMWEQQDKYYTLKSAAISGCQRVDMSVFPKHRLLTSTDPRQRWRLASSRLKIWLDDTTPEGAELLALSLDFQRKALHLISRQADCQRGQGSSTS